MALPVVFPNRHVLHVPDGEIWVGVRIAGTELPARGEVIAARLAGGRVPSSRLIAVSSDDLTSVHIRRSSSNS